MTNNAWESDPQWRQLVGDLRAYRDAQLRAFEGVDDLLVARFVAGECSTDEAATVQAAMFAQPAVRELVDVLQEVVATKGFPNLDAGGMTSRMLIPRAANVLHKALAFASKLQSEAPGQTDWLELDGPLIAAWEQAVGAASAERLELTERALFQNDRLFAVAAGDEDREQVIASLPWYTDLTDWPTSLDWDFVTGAPSWSVRLACRAASLKWTIPAMTTRVEFPLDLSVQAPRGKDILWEVHACDATGKADADSLVRGVFRVLPLDEIAALTAELASAARIEDPDRRNFVEFGYLVERKCFATAIERLEHMTADQSTVHLRLLRWRGLASIYLWMHRELTGQRRLGVPEGLWALQLSRENLRAAYALLGLKFPEK